MSYRTIITSLILINVTVVSAKSNDCPIKLSQHSTDKNKSSKPAMLLYTNSQQDGVLGEDKETYSIDAALSIECPLSKTNEYMFAVEAHKNDLTAKETDSLALRAGWSMNRLNDKHYRVQTSLGYINDYVKDTKSVQAISDFEFLYEDWYVNSPWIGEISAFMWSPVLAVEYERFIHDPDSKEGGVLRAMYGINSTYSFFENKARGLYRIVFDASYSYWHNIKDSDLLELSNNHELTTMTLSYIIDKSTEYEIALSYKYQNGEDIRNKIADNEFDQIGFSVSFTFK
ncbi:MAG: hypothetical protein V7733_11285 [Paraglaciecola polaris]|uniref:hypothetical protein n=1 Tax=Paraglaciecola polaris TaxID=222814 RepID=UPI003002523E